MANNPLSPHLQVYKPQLTSILSISHRISGVFLSLGTVVLLYWLVSAALGEQAYNNARQVLAMPLVQLVLLGWTYAFFLHLCSGLRHLMFDTGRGLEIATAYKTGYAVIAASIMLTALSWGCVLAQGGGA